MVELGVIKNLHIKCLLFHRLDLQFCMQLQQKCIGLVLKREVNVIQSMCANIISDHELDQLLKDIELSEPEFKGDLSKPQESLFTTVMPSTAEPETEASLALKE